MNAIDYAIKMAERGRLPDSLLRLGIRRLLKKRLRAIGRGDCETQLRDLKTLLHRFSSGPIAAVPEKANEQHYEVGADVFKHMLGPRFKYSCCFWESAQSTLGQAEEASLATTCERGELADGMRILELGCGWGSLTLWMAEQFPNAKITAVSNSHSQREFILQRAASAGIGNVDVLTRDMNDLQLEQSFDRVVSIEMFEHMRNHAALMQKIDSWLVPGGKLFVHLFCHRQFTYEFVDQSASDWMSRYFFSGGIMPSDSLMFHFQSDLNLIEHWRWNGIHYRRTADAWLANMDESKQELLPILAKQYDAATAEKWFHRWRMFYLACSELFGYDNGDQWWVSHYLFEKPAVG